MNALVFVSASVLLLTASDVFAQKQYSPELNDFPGSDALQRTGQGAQDRQKSGKISLKVQDSSVGYIVRTLGKLSGIPVIFNSAESAFAKRVSVNVANANVMDAFKEALKGTGLTASYASDGRTILVSPSVSKDSLSNRQSGYVKGQVVDSASGKGIKGVSVSVSGASLMVITDDKGFFTLSDVPAGKQLIMFKLLGYRSANRSVDVSGSGTSSIKVTLTQSATSLNEVVTTATGLQRRVEVPSDIVKIDAEKIRQRAPVRSVADMIEAAQVPGVVVTRASGDPGAPRRVRIRGVGSISQSNDPVYIVDGMWVDESIYDRMDPETIETFEIIRGPSAATLYGQDAANGVIVITTKKGTPGNTRWNMNYSRDWGKAYGKMPLFYEGFGYNPITGARRTCKIQNVLLLECVQDSVAIYDPNSSMVLREGQEQKDIYSLSLDGGTNAVRYALSLNTNDIIGVRRAAPIDLIRLRKWNIKYDRDVLKPSRLKDHKISSNLSLQPREGLDIQFLVRAGFATLVDNKYNFSVGNRLSLDTMAFLSDGVRRDIGQTFKVRHTNTTSFGSSVSWRSKNDILVKGNAGIDQTNMNESGSGENNSCLGTQCYDDLGTRDERTSGNTVLSLRTNISTVLSRGRFSRFLDLRPTAGFDFRSVKNDNFAVFKDSVPGGESSIESGRVTNTLGGRKENADAGWYLSSMIGVFKRIYFDLGIRQDVGSAITSSSSTTYPKLGGSWLLSDEGFWPENKIVNLFRLRASLGHAAVQPDVADIKGKYIIGTKFIDGKLVRSLELVNVGNSELVPERSVELETGFDMYMFNERINLIATYAHKENKNTLVTVQLPSSVGKDDFPLQRKENIGRVENRSLELTINSIVMDKDWLRIAADYSHTFSDNTVKSLGRGINNITPNIAAEGTYRDHVAVGYPLASIWRNTIMGYLDENGDGIIAPNERIMMDSLTYVGPSTPRYRGSYGINATIIGKIIVDSRFSYQSSHVPNYTGQSGSSYGEQDVNAPLDVQALSYGMLGVTPISDFRWNSASISYTLSPRRFSFISTRTISFALQAANIALWTKFVGRDPGINTGMLSGNEMLTIDYGVTPPPPRTFAFNVRLGL